MPAAEAARFADVWVTVTGNCKVVDGPVFENMKDGAIVCNSGHFDSEINLEWLETTPRRKRKIKPLVEEYTLPDGRTVIVLAQGRLVNLSCAEGHPASVMDTASRTRRWPPSTCTSTPASWRTRRTTCPPPSIRTWCA